SWVPRAAYYGIAREARKVGIPFAGHVPYSVSVVEASDAGQRSIEHEDDLSRACSSADSVLRARSADTATLAKQAQEIRQQAAVLQRTYDSVSCRAVIATLARHDTGVTPTLLVYA